MRDYGVGCWCLFLWLAIGFGPARADGVLTVFCPNGKTVQCDQAWAFDTPQTTSTCTIGGGYVDQLPYVTTTNGTCPRVLTRTWTFTDYCGNTSVCSQAVTLLDTNPPAALCSGINLAPNPSFENQSSCPSYFGQVALATPWYQPSVATPDHFKICAPGPFVSVPTNFSGVQAPLSGSGYLGAILFAQTGGDNATSYREYVQAPLLAPLVSGQVYRVAFHVSLSESSTWAIASIGAHFSAGPELMPASQFVMPLVPQVVNPSTNFLTNTLAWTLVQGTFVATGGESYVTIGNFLSDAATSNTPAGGVESNAYYYIDDVSITALCAETATGKTVACGSPWTFDPPRPVDPCSGSNVAVTIAATVTNAGCPRVITRTWTLTDPCGNTGAWSQAVTLLDSAPPQFSCDCLGDAALIQLATNTACLVAVPNFAQFTQCFFEACGPVSVTSSPPAGTLLGPGSHSITVRVSDCSANVATCIVPFVVTAPAPVITCPSNLVVLTCSNSVTVHYLVTATGATGAVACVPPSGSVFTPGVTPVTCYATSACGGVATCSFNVTVKPPRPRWFCWSTLVGIGIGYSPVGGATHALRPGPDGFPAIHVDPGSADPGAGLVLTPGPAEAISFITVLDFNAPVGAGIDLHLPASAQNTGDVPLVRFRRVAAGGYDVRVGRRHADDLSGTFRAFAVNTNGHLLDSVAYDVHAARTGDVLNISGLPGVSNCHVMIDLDCRTGAVSLEIDGPFVPSARHKGWDGCIYGPDRPIKKGKPTARVIVLPPVAPAEPPITEMRLSSATGAPFVIEEPSLTMMRRRWSDGHVTLMKAYDDGGESGMDFMAGGPGGGVAVGLGNASNFEFRVTQFDNGMLPQQEQYFRVSGWPPGTTTNRPVFTNTFGLARNVGGGVDCFAEFAQWGVTSVTVQLFNHGAPVSEALHVPATLTAPVATLGGFPGVIGCPGVGVVKLADPGGVVVLSGLDCGGLPCVGDELRILAEPAAGSTNPVAFTRLEILVSEDMDQRIADLQVTPAVSPPPPLHAAPAPGGFHFSWSGEGLLLQGAETVYGPWFNLGPAAPATIPPLSTSRVFRLTNE